MFHHAKKQQFEFLFYSILFFWIDDIWCEFIATTRKNYEIFNYWKKSLEWINSLKKIVINHLRDWLKFHLLRISCDIEFVCVWEREKDLKKLKNILRQSKRVINLNHSHTSAIIRNAFVFFHLPAFSAYQHSNFQLLWCR